MPPSRQLPEDAPEYVSASEAALEGPACRRLRRWRTHSIGLLGTRPHHSTGQGAIPSLAQSAAQAAKRPPARRRNRLRCAYGYRRMNAPSSAFAPLPLLSSSHYGVEEPPSQWERSLSVDVASPCGLRCHQ